MNLLLINIANLDRRVREYITRTDTDAPTNSLNLVYLEEVLERCCILHEEVINSIENWTDIVPEADVKTQIGVITMFRQQLLDYQAERILLTTQLHESQGKSQQEIQELGDAIAFKERQMTEIRKQLSEARQQVSRGLVSGAGNIGANSFVASSGGGIVVNFGEVSSVLMLQKVCTICKKTYQDSLVSNVILLPLGDICPDCRSKRNS